MSNFVPIARDFTATVPDDKVNRHVNVRLLFDPATGEVSAEADLNAARVAAGLPPHDEPAPVEHEQED